MKKGILIGQWYLLSLMSLAMMMGGCSDEYAGTAMAPDDFYSEDRFAQFEMAEAEEGDFDGDTARQATGSESAAGAEGNETPRGQRLIYTAEVILAIYDVANVQMQALEVVEQFGGYVSRRSSERLTARVPAGSFHSALEAIADLGDTLDVSWEAQDVSEQMRDLEIRLRNSLELRDRLQILLERADTVEDALRIEAELERITLEIERIRGHLESLGDRVAYSTIVVVFQTIRTEEMPGDDFLLPVAWVHDLGLESLLRSTGGLR